MYGANYTDHGRHTHELFFNAKMYCAADKYGLFATSSLAVEKFTLTRRHAIITAAGCALFIGVARQAYEKTPPANDSLRLVIAQLCTKNHSKLIAHPKFKPMSQITRYWIQIWRPSLARCTRIYMTASTAMNGHRVNRASAME
jgi:hypothetical protein